MKAEVLFLNVQKRLMGLFCAGLALFLPWGNRASASDIQDLAWKEDVPYYRQIQGTITHGGPKLIFSDSPEMVGKIGIMYRDTVSGPVRLFFHHVNDTRTDKRLAVLLRRTTIRPTAVSMGRNGISRPNEDWLAAGKEAQSKYYRSVPNGRKLVLDGPPGHPEQRQGVHSPSPGTGHGDRGLELRQAGGSFLHHDARGCGSPDFGGSIFHPAAGRRGPCAPGHL
jgi:hypothetical protein